MRLLKNYDNKITKKYNSLLHKGIDIVGKGNNNSSHTDFITAHSDGEVVWIQEYNINNKLATGNTTYGNAVKIKHNNGMYTLYAHLSRINVKKGSKVLKGQTIGYMGNTGRSYGAHLHFELRDVSDKRIDPTSYLESNLPGCTNKVYNKVNAKSGCWVRKGIGFKYSKEKLLPYGTKVEVLNSYVGTSNGYDWAQIKYNNQVLYIPNKYISKI